MAGESPTGQATGAIGFGAAAMLFCCGSHLLVVGVLGGLAMGTVLGVGAGIVALIAFVTVLAVARRRRRPAACAVPATRSAPRASADAPTSSTGLTKSRPKESFHVF